MHYLDFERLERIDPEAFRAQKPYPWVNPEGLVTEEGFRRLCETLPDVAIFEKVFAVARKHGQKPHDRYALEFREDLPLSEPWRHFLAEVRSRRYRDDLCRLLGVRRLALDFHWHYTPNGCSVSPHCDSTRKLGSHIFYFNTRDDWDPDWGGETLILDDHGRFDRRSAPRLEEFEPAIPSEAIGNRSLLFGRKANSWHAVREIRCPEDRMRKVFIVVINGDRPIDRIRALVTGRRDTRY